MADAMGILVTFPASAQLRPAILRIYSLKFLMLIIVVAIVNNPVLVMGGHSSSPSTLVVYLHEKFTPPNATALVVVSPSATNGRPPIGFGSIIVVENTLRQGQAEDSLVLGATFGGAALVKDLSFYISQTFLLCTRSYTGSIRLHGLLDPSGNGEVGIFTGTGNLRWARGYADVYAISMVDGIIVFKIVLHIRYD